MFVRRKLKKLRRYASKELERMDRYLRKYPGSFDQEARRDIEHAEKKLKKAMEADDPAELGLQLKEYKRCCDRFLPFYKSSVVREYAEAIIIALILALIIRHFIIQAFKIPSGSMVPTLLVGDHIVVNKFIYGVKIPFVEKKILALRKPSRGDIIVFKPPHRPKTDYIKRVVGTPGDTIEVRSGDLWVNGEIVTRERVEKYNYISVNQVEMEDSRGRTITKEIREPIEAVKFKERLDSVTHDILLENFNPGLFQRVGKWKVPEGRYFVMGDNRDRSNDSRFWGTVDFNHIRGKAIVIYFSWPWRQLTRFGHPVR